MSKGRQVLFYILDRMGESSTWQGIGALAVLTGAKGATDMDWGSAAALGIVVSGVIKILFPDNKKRGPK